MLYVKNDPDRWFGVGYYYIIDGQLHLINAEEIKYVEIGCVDRFVMRSLSNKIYQAERRAARRAEQTEQIRRTEERIMQAEWGDLYDTYSRQDMAEMHVEFLRRRPSTADEFTPL